MLWHQLPKEVHLHLSLSFVYFICNNTFNHWYISGGGNTIKGDLVVKLTCTCLILRFESWWEKKLLLEELVRSIEIRMLSARIRIYLIPSWILVLEKNKEIWPIGWKKLIFLSYVGSNSTEVAVLCGRGWLKFNMHLLKFRSNDYYLFSCFYYFIFLYSLCMLEFRYIFWQQKNNMYYLILLYVYVYCLFNLEMLHTFIFFNL